MSPERLARLLRDMGAPQGSAMLPDPKGLWIFPSEGPHTGPEKPPFAEKEHTVSKAPPTDAASTDQRVLALRDAMEIISREVHELQVHTTPAVRTHQAVRPPVVTGSSAKSIVALAAAGVVVLASLSWLSVRSGDDATVVLPAAPGFALWPGLAPPSPPRYPVANQAPQAPLPRSVGAKPQDPTASRRAAAFSGTLRVDSSPSGARVFVNQRAVGVTPLQVKLPATSYAVWVEHDGYQRWTTGIQLPADQQTRIRAQLTLAPAGAVSDIRSP